MVFKTSPRRQPTEGRRLSLETLEPRVALDASMLRITEFMASNVDGLRDYDGDATDWIEIYNSGPDAVDLGGMRLSDSASQWTIPSGVSLAPGGYRVVFASNKDTIKPNGELHTNFALSVGGEYLALIANDGATIIDEYAPKFLPQREDVSYGRAMATAGSGVTLISSGAQAKAWVPTSSALDGQWRDVAFNDSAFNISGPTGLGYENSPGDLINYTAEIKTVVPSTTRSLYVRIPFTLTSLADIGRLTLRMKYDDGFIAYLNGVPIADANAPDGAQWNSTASGSHADSDSKIFQSFDASAAIPHLQIGQNILAIHGLNVVGGTDMLILPELVANALTLISPDRIGYLEAATPGYGNGQTFAGYVEEPTFSLPHGYYTTQQTVTLSTATPGSVIVYTTDGSTPAVNANLTPTKGALYTSPITISGTTILRATAFKTDYKPSFVASSTYLFLNDVISQSPQGQTLPGWAPSGTNGQFMDYGIDPDIINLYGAQAVKSSLQSLPAISITTDLPNLFDTVSGIYVNATNDGRTWERPASVELLNSDGSEGFAVNAGLRIRGGYSRNDFNPKHAFRLFFRGEYGDAKLRYPLFGGEGVDEFDVMDLRTDQNYAWSTEGNVQYSAVREVFARDLQRDLGDPYTRTRYYHLYLNGKYWGLYQTQERVNDSYGESYFGGEEEDYDVVKSGTNDGQGTVIDAGNDAAWNRLFTLAQNLAVNPTANASNYWTLQGLNPDGTRNPSLPVLLDADNLINYMLIIFYTGGYDSGLSRFIGDNQANNWYGIYNRTKADEGFQFFMHDNEHSLGAESTVHGTQFIDRTGPFNNGNQNSYAYFNPQYLHQDLLSHVEYRQRFIEKVQTYFFNNGPMTPAASIARMSQRVSQVSAAIMAESARWGDTQVTPPRNVSTWQTEINWLLNTYFPGRTNTVLSQLKTDGLYIVAPTLTPGAGRVAIGSLLTMAAPGGGAGTIYYTTDGVTDPRVTGGGINPSAAVRTYTGAIPLTEGVTIRARFRTSTGAWSALTQGMFTAERLGDFDSDLVVDGTDFLLWQRQLGSAVAAPGEESDGNFDGAVNAADVGVWRTNFGASYPAPISAALSAALSEDIAASDAGFSSLAAYDAVYGAMAYDVRLQKLTSTDQARSTSTTTPEGQAKSGPPYVSSNQELSESYADPFELLWERNAATEEPRPSVLIQDELAEFTLPIFRDPI